MVAPRSHRVVVAAAAHLASGPVPVATRRPWAVNNSKEPSAAHPCTLVSGTLVYSTCSLNPLENEASENSSCASVLHFSWVTARAANTSQERLLFSAVSGAGTAPMYKAGFHNNLLSRREKSALTGVVPCQVASSCLFVWWMAGRLGLILVQRLQVSPAGAQLFAFGQNLAYARKCSKADVPCNLSHSCIWLLVGDRFDSWLGQVISVRAHDRLPQAKGFKSSFVCQPRKKTWRKQLLANQLASFPPNGTAMVVLALATGPRGCLIVLIGERSRFDCSAFWSADPSLDPRRFGVQLS